MPIDSNISVDSVEIENLGQVTLSVHNFTKNGVNNWGPRGVYASSLNSIVGYWFNRTVAPTTASLSATEVSLVSGTRGQFRFITNELPCKGKLYVLTLS